MAKILIVEDCEELALAFQAALVQHDASVAANIDQARNWLVHEKFDLILMDIQLPDGSGLQFFAELSSQETIADVPVLFITGRSEIGDKLIAFSLGAEDFVTKPVDTRELRARVEAKLKKRTIQPAAVKSTVRRGFLTIHKDSQRAVIAGPGGHETLLTLTPFAFKLMIFFAENEDKVFTRDSIVEHVWGPGTHVFHRTIDAHISKIRKKLKGSGYNIQSIYGEGYVFRKSLDRVRSHEAIV